MGVRLTYLVTEVRDEVLLKELFFNMSSIRSIRLKQHKNKQFFAVKELGDVLLLQLKQVRNCAFQSTQRL